MGIRKITLSALVLMALALAGCNPEIDAQVATLNARATEIAGLGQEVAPTLDAALHPTATPTIPIVIYDLTADTGALLSSAWGETYGMARGTPFTLVATQGQVSVFVTQILDTNGWGGIVFSPTVTIGAGQTRMDFGIVNQGNFGQATVTFQPTLDTSGQVELHLLGADFGNVQPPSGLTFALGDSIRMALTGQSNAILQRVRLTELSLQDGAMRASGVVTD
jgi:hypothetical protein